MATAATLRIGPADHGRALTLDEFRDADEEPGYRYELARATLEVTEVPNDPHGQVEWNILRALVDYALTHPTHQKRLVPKPRSWLLFSA